VDTQGRGVERFTKRGILVGETEYEVDCVVFATGFEAGISYTRLTGFEIYGRGGTPLSEHWRQGVRTLHGITTDKFPNCLFVGGNQHSAAAVNAVHLLDEQARHVAYVVGQARDRGALVLEPSPDAVEDYGEAIRSSAKNRAQVEFFKACTPGYYNGEGKATRTEELFLGARWGDGAMAFYGLLANWREKGDLPGMVLV
jgi:cyclohexanone monooxygenase